VALERALSQPGAWHRKMPGRAWFAVNVSAPEIAQGDAYVEKIEACLRATRSEGSCLELEVTERVLMSSLAENVETPAPDRRARRGASRSTTSAPATPASPT